MRSLKYFRLPPVLMLAVLPFTLYAADDPTPRSDLEI